MTCLHVTQSSAESRMVLLGFFRLERIAFFHKKIGWGARDRTRIHRFKVWCAAIAPRPSALKQGSILTQFF